MLVLDRGFENGSGGMVWTSRRCGRCRGGCAGGVLAVLVAVGRGSQAQAEAHACATSIGEGARQRRRLCAVQERKARRPRQFGVGLRLVCSRVQVPAVACSVCVCGCVVWTHVRRGASRRHLERLRPRFLQRARDDLDAQTPSASHVHAHTTPQPLQRTLRVERVYLVHACECRGLGGQRVRKPASNASSTCISRNQASFPSPLIFTRLVSITAPPPTHFVLCTRTHIPQGRPHVFCLASRRCWVSFRPRRIDQTLRSPL